MNLWRSIRPIFEFPSTPLSVFSGACTSRSSARIGGAFWLCLAAPLIGACGQSATDLPPSEPAALEKKDTQKKSSLPGPASAEGAGWVERTYSPQPGSTPEPLLEKAEKACGRGDMALHQVAHLLSSRQSDEGEASSLDVAKFHLMRWGAPYVMPRLWSATVKGISGDQLAESIGKWASVRPALGEYRCGLAMSEGEDGAHTVTVLQVDVLVDVDPVPTLVQAGTWIDFEATFLAPTSSATVLLLPPEGLPKHLSTDLKGAHAKARFSIETKGTWLLQLMATQTGGPRPVAQMLITADAPRPTSLNAQPVPGEDAFDEKKSPDDALLALMNGARRDQGLPPLKRNRTLDRVAKKHSDAMKKTGRISHDTGAGDPAYRVSLSGLSPKATGENVAMAGNVVRLHRVLWASPAHRENLLLRRWDETGVGLVRDEEGALFATQLFIDQD